MIEAEAARTRLQLSDRVEENRRGTLDRRIDESSPPFLAAAAFDQLGRRPLVLVAHARLRRRSAARVTAGPRPKECLASLARDQADQAEQPEHAPREPATLLLGRRVRGRR